MATETRDNKQMIKIRIRVSDLPDGHAAMREGNLVTQTGATVISEGNLKMCTRVWVCGWRARLRES